MKEMNRDTSQFGKEAKASFGDDFDLFMKLSEFDQDVDTKAAWNSISLYKTESLKRDNYRFFWKLAAIIVLGILLGGGVYQFYPQDLSSSLSELSSPTGKRTIELTDGTTVTLAQGAVLKLNLEDFNEDRRVELTGKAFFDVVKNGNPFLIESSLGSIEVLGTTFNVNASEELTVSVVSGIVRVKSALGAIELQKGQSIRVGKKGVLERYENQNLNLLSWKDGDFVFKNQTLEEIVPLLEEYYEVDFSISRSLKSCRVTAEFEGASLESVVSTIARVLNAKTKISDKKVRISGKGCD